MADLSKLSSGYSNLKQGSLWSGGGKCKGYATANTGEASQIDQYVAALVAGGSPIAPSLGTATGKGIVLIIQGGYGASVSLSKLSTGYSTLKTGTLWSSTGRCKGYATSNPGEAVLIDQYVSGLVAVGSPTIPSLATLTGRGIVSIIQGGYTPASAPTPTPQPGYTFNAWEHDNCSFSGSMQVIYGANGVFTIPRTFATGVLCDNATFGDPLPGTFKHCEIASAAAFRVTITGSTVAGQKLSAVIS